MLAKEVVLALSVVGNSRGWVLALSAVGNSQGWWGAEREQVQCGRAVRWGYACRIGLTRAGGYWHYPQLGISRSDGVRRGEKKRGGRAVWWGICLPGRLELSR